MQNAISTEVTGKVEQVKLFSIVYNFTSRHVKISYLLIFLFAYTAVSKLNLFVFTPGFKLVDLEAFKGAMGKSPVLRPYVDELAYLIPISEIITCILLLFHKTTRWGYYQSLFLLTLFTAYIVFILIAYKQALPCTCGGVISAMTWAQHLLFNCVFMCLALKAIFRPDKQ
jgi:hypothetical protein